MTRGQGRASDSDSDSASGPGPASGEAAGSGYCQWTRAANPEAGASSQTSRRLGLKVGAQGCGVRIKHPPAVSNAITITVAVPEQRAGSGGVMHNGS